MKCSNKEWIMLIRMFDLKMINLIKKSYGFCWGLLIIFLLIFSIPRTVCSQKAELLLQSGHSNGTPETISFSPDGKILASGSDDNKIILWDMRTLKAYRTLTGHSYSVNSITFSPDGKTLTSGDGEGVVKLWNISTEKEIYTLSGQMKYVRSVVFSPNGKLLAILGGEVAKTKKINLWDTHTGQKLQQIKGSADQFRSIAFSPDSNILASSGLKVIKFWDTNSGKEIFSIRGHSHWIDSIAFSPDGKILASGDGRGIVKLWDIVTGKEMHTFPKQMTYVNSVAFSPDGKTLASGCGYSGMKKSFGDIKLWDVSSGRELHTLKGPGNFSVKSLSFSHDSKVLASASGHVISLWDVKKGKEFSQLKGYLISAKSVMFSPDGKILASGHGNGTIKLWDITTGKVTTIKASSSGVAYLLFSPNGKYLISETYDGIMKVWDAASGMKIKTLKGNTHHIKSISFSPDGSMFATSMGRLIKLWDTETLTKIHTITGLSHIVNSVSFSPDGRFLASGGFDKTVIIWPLSDGTNSKKIKIPSYIKSLVFSPHGKILAIGDYDNRVTLWNMKTGKVLNTIRGASSTGWAISFSPDGKLLASGEGDGKIRLWEIATGKEVQLLTGHTDWVQSVTFSPDGTMIASGSLDGKVNLWDFARGRLKASLISVNKTDYISITADNYYTASKAGLKGVAFRFNNTILPFEQFDLRFNRPDIVLKRIGYASQDLISSYHKTYQKRLKKMNFTEDMLSDDFYMPEIAITSQSLPVFTKKKTLKFSIKATDSKYLLDRLNVYVNDVPIYGINGINLRNKKAATLSKDINIELSNGKNKIQVSVLNNRGAESLKKTFEVIHNGPATLPDLYVVAIGISNYRDDKYNLTYAAKDAKDLATLFEERIEGFDKINVLRILDEDATKENILKAKVFLMKSKIDDHVILFIAGHGLIDGKLDYYFATTDMNFSNPAARGLPYEEIENMVDGIPARKKLVLIDTCHSGEMDKDVEGEAAEPTKNLNRNVVLVNSFRGIKLDIGKRSENSLGQKDLFELLKELFVDLRRGTGAMVISSASGMEFAYESDKWKNGVFTYALLEGLKTKTADVDQNDIILVSELRDYVIEKVQKLTSGAQTPTSRRENLEFDFRVF